MNEIIKVPFILDIEKLCEQMKIRPSMLDEFTDLVKLVEEAACPKVMIREAFVEAHGDGYVVINNVSFTSATLRHNLDGIGRVFAYITTCGREVEELPIDTKDFVLGSWLHYIKLDLLKNCFPVLRNTVKTRLGVEKLSSMNPGSGDASVWPIDQQVGLFSLFGDVEELIGVRLTDSFLMSPDVSTSGILFPTEQEYKNCQLCHRKDCPNRTAAFNAKLWEKVNKH